MERSSVGKEGKQLEFLSAAGGSFTWSHPFRKLFGGID